MILYNRTNMSEVSVISDQEIQSFLDSFDGDVVKAMRAISHYAHSRKHLAKKTQYEPTGPVLVKLDNVKKSYKVGRVKISALAGVTLTIHQGEFVALTGASGSGKSTLLQLIGGLDKPNEGTVEVGGVNIGKLRDGKLSTFRNKTVGFVFQFFYLQPFLKVKTNLEVPGMFARTKRQLRQQNVKLLSDAVGITDRMNHLPRELSGGQMQRAAIARALLNNPKILLADEPTGNLDSVNGKAIIELFDKIRKEFGTTVIIVTHDPQIAARADRIIRLKDGLVI